ALAEDPEMRCAMNLRYSEGNVERLSMMGLSIGCFDRGEEPDMVSSMEWGTTEAIKGSGHVPDVIYDRGGPGKEPMIRVLGKDPEQVLFKIVELIK
ncbi:MAG: hypothetical protein MIO90_04155, partial [Methanomassiliicoccales archaeon]|nr:hypothetical protein [Methanomassiliicoccales archaeon]